MAESRMERAARIAAAKSGPATAKKPRTPAGGSSDDDQAPPVVNPRRLPLQQTEEPVAYYDSSRGTYWKKNSEGEYMQVTEASLRRTLKYETYGHIWEKEDSAIYCDRHLMLIQDTCNVSFAGPLAGYRAGLHTICGRKMLVTSSPKLIVPKEGKWPTLKKFIDELLGEQAVVLHAWLKASLKTLYKGAPFRPAPMLAIAGPANCGKSLLQNIITEIFGGRASKPYRYMIGETPFNAEIFGAEHLMIEDDATQTDLRFRRTFGAQLKNVVYNETQSLRGMFKGAVTVHVFARVTITMNDETENLAVIPPIDDSLADKIILLQASMATFPYGNDDLDGRRRFRETLTKELPAYLHFLRGFRVPERLQSRRSGVAAYRDPHLVHELLLLSPQLALLELIDRLWIWGPKDDAWIGTAAELQDALVAKDRSGRAGKLLEWRQACGTYLGRLMRDYPTRIFFKEHGSIGRIWTVKKPTS